MIIMELNLKYFPTFSMCVGCTVTDLAQVRLPELQVAPGDEGGAYGVVEDVLDAKLVEDAGLVVRDPQLLGDLPATLRR